MLRADELITSKENEEFLQKDVGGPVNETAGGPVNETAGTVGGAGRPSRDADWDWTSGAPLAGTIQQLGSSYYQYINSTAPGRLAHSFPATNGGEQANPNATAASEDSYSASRLAKKPRSRSIALSIVRVRAQRSEKAGQLDVDDMYPSKPSEQAGAAPVTGIPVGGPAAAASQWSSGLFDCFDDCGLCCLTCWCPCITFGRMAEIVDRGATSCGTAGALYTLLAYFTGCQWIYSCTYRAKMRAQFGLPDTPCCDCCVHFCCEPCALCQQYKELKARGYDPVLGWDQQGAAAMHPPAAQGMGR